MTAISSYSTGTVAVAANATVIIGTGTIWSSVNVRPGDDIVIAGHTVVVLDVTDVTHLVIDPWPYATVSAASYKVIQRSPQRFAGAVGAPGAPGAPRHASALGLSPSGLNAMTR